MSTRSIWPMSLALPQFLCMRFLQRFSLTRPVFIVSEQVQKKKKQLRNWNAPRAEKIFFVVSGSTEERTAYEGLNTTLTETKRPNLMLNSIHLSFNSVYFASLHRDIDRSAL